jgi:hypothetical protein
MNKRQELLKQKEKIEKQLIELDEYSRPQMLSDDELDWSNLKAMMINIMADYEDEGRALDPEYYIYECVMKTLYGPDVFKWINNQTK